MRESYARAERGAAAMRIMIQLTAILAAWSWALPACTHRPHKADVEREAMERERKLSGPCGKVPGLKICAKGAR